MQRTITLRASLLSMTLLATVVLPISALATVAATTVTTSVVTSSAKATSTAAVTAKVTTAKTTVVTTTKAAAVAAKPSPINRIWYFVDGTQARLSFFAHAKYIDVFAPQSYSVDRNGNLTGSVASDLLAFSKKNNIKVEPLVVNSGFSSTSVDVFLNNPDSQDRAISSLISQAQINGYAGYQLDFEQIDASDKFKFSAFVKRFGTAMKAASLISSVAVIAQTGADPSTYPKNTWQTIVGAYDYAAIASSTDFVSLMSYDDPTSDGPIVGWQWYLKVLKYSLTQIPAKQLSLGLGLYNWQWNENIDKRVGIGGHVGLQEEIDTYKTTQYYSTVQQAPYISYKIKGIPYTVWFENGQSVKNKLSLVTKYGLAGFSVWALGLEQPTVYNSLPTTGTKGQ